MIERATLMAALAALVVGGCRLVQTGRPAPPPTQPPPRPPTPTAKELEERIRAELEREMRKEVERRVAEEVDKARREWLEVDFNLLPLLLDKAKASVLERDKEKALSSLGRLRVALGALCSASDIGATSQAVLRSLNLVEKGDLEVARANLNLALQSAEGLKVGEISLPDKLKQALSLLEEGKVEEAKRALEEVERALAGHPFFIAVEKVFEHLDGAAMAVGREAWRVAEAEIEEASGLLGDIEKYLKPPAEKEKPPEAKPEEEKAPPKAPTPSPPTEGAV